MSETHKEPFIIGLDLDGVCANFQEGFSNFYCEQSGNAIEDLPKLTRYDFKEWGISDVEFMELVGQFTENHFFSKMPTYENCSEVLWRLSDAGVWIRVITARLFIAGLNAKVASDTSLWLDQNNIPYRELCFVTKKPHVDADIYIDDSPKNIAALTAAGKETITFAHDYNQESSGIREDNWLDIEKTILEKLRAFNAS